MNAFEFDPVAFLQSINAPSALPEEGDASWPIDEKLRQEWIAHALSRLFGQDDLHLQALDGGTRIVVDTLADLAADVATWAIVARCAIEAEPGLDEDARELLRHGLREATSASQQAWDAVGRMRALLDAIGVGRV
jgi:hypothetical protein